MAQEDEAILRTVGCLERLSSAFAVYDRSLFYYDPALDQAKADNERVDAQLNYKQVLDELPPEPPQDAADELQKAYRDQLLDHSYELGDKTALVYYEAITALNVRYEHTTTIYREWIANPLARLGGFAADRDVENAGGITKAHITNCRNLAQKIAQKYAVSQTWCSYSVEFKLLKAMCELVMDEIDFLNRRVNELQQRWHQRLAMMISVSAIMVSICLKGCASEDHGTAAIPPQSAQTAKVNIVTTSPGKSAPSEPITVTFKIPEPKSAPQPQP